MFGVVIQLITNFKYSLKDWKHSAAGQMVVPFILLILVGTFGYRILEGWTLLDSLYATIITITTVGYGDLSPQTPVGRIFAILFTLVAIGLAGYAISALAAIVFERQAEQQKRLDFQRRMERIKALNDHIIVCGASTFGHRTCAELQQHGKQFVLVEQDRETLKRALLFLHDGYVKKMSQQHLYQDLDTLEYEEEQMSLEELADDAGINYLLADPLNERVLIQAGLLHADGLVTAMDDDLDNVAVILSARDIIPKIGNDKLRIVSRVSDERNWRRLYLAGAHKVVAPNFIAGFNAATQLLDTHTGDLFDSMIVTQGTNLRMKSYPISDWPELTDLSCSRFQDVTGMLLVAIRRDNDFIFSPSQDFVLRENDVALVMAEI